MELNENSQENKTPWNGVIIQSKPDTEPEIVEESPEEKLEEENLTPENTSEEVVHDDIDDEPILDDAPEDEEDINPYFYLSSKLKSDGFLLEEFDPKENVSGLEVYDAYRKKLQKELEPRITQEVYNKLQSEGVTSEDLLVARAIRQGVDIALLSESTMHERYASLNDKSDRDSKLNSIRAMYQSRKFSTKEIENLVNIATADDDENLDDYFSESTQFHKSRWQHFQQEEKERVIREEQTQQAQLDAAEKLVNKIFTARELLGDKLDEQESAILREGIYSPTDRLDIGGQEYTVSKLYKFNYELETNPELKLWLFKKYLTRGMELDSLRKEVTKELEDDIMKAYETSVKKDLRARKKKEIVQKLEETSKPEEQKSTRKSWMVEF